MVDEKYQGMEEEELDDEDLEALEQNTAPKKKPLVKKKVAKKPLVKPEAVNKRFGVFATPERVGVVDRETGEVIAEGNAATLEILAEVLERLERIETNLGSMMGGQ